MADKKVVAPTQKTKKGLDVTIRFFDSFIRTMDALKKSLDGIKERNHDLDALVNNGVGYVEDKKLTHGISIGATNAGVYGGSDVVYNANSGEYLVLTKMGEIIRYDWAGKKLGSVVPTKKFIKFIYIPQTGNFICYNPGKSVFFILKEEFHLAMDAVSISPIDKIVYSGRRTDENSFEFFIVNKDTLNKYSYSPSGNTVTLQECLKIADIEAEEAVIEHICFDEPMDDKKQWIYMAFKQHCTIIDATGRTHGTKRNLHRLPITAMVVVGPSEFIVTGDSIGLIKMWGFRWTFITEIRPHTQICTHLLEHPNGRASALLMTRTTFQLESMRAPEIVEKITVNKVGKSFMTLGPRKLVLWKMDVLFSPLATMSSPVARLEMTWNPDYPHRTIAVSQDNAVRFLNPITGKMITTALVNPPKPPLTDYAYIPQFATLYTINNSPEDINALEIQLFDCTLNPCRVREVWQESKWNVGVTAIALFDYIPSMLIPEKVLAFTSKKQAEVVGVKTFLIAGMRDGTVGRMCIRSGEIDYKVSCHKGQVNNIQVNPEVCQFATMGSEPSIRIWKIFVNQEELFVPIFEITWKYPVRHVAVIREAICFALSHHDSATHKIVVFNTLDTERHDHRAHFGHTREVVSVSGSRELMLFCSASMDDTIRIWNDKCDLVRLLALNWPPTYAAFGTPQGDIFVGILSAVNLVPADKFLPIIYRNRAMVNKLNAGAKENPIPLNTQRGTQDPRMYIVLEEEDKNERERKEREKDKEKDKKRFIPPSERKPEEADNDIRVPPIESFREPKDSQRAKDYDKFRILDEDLKQIMEGNHQFSIYVPDFHKMSKKQLDEYGKTVFTGEDGDKRKLFSSESRIAGMVEMERAMKDLDNFEED
ncbi:hypothetical protein Ocin01_06074 [Orchesella cincta]|uniref:WD repeat-containing protein on Y chromosome n=1 Tax=Orchesella cincta TaxID=48709 RepID=A0A1D2N6J4_ORCCI|nr:hypothetical protein Ocin01_06074 [Orchesella cincta]